MPTKAELLADAEAIGIEVPSGATKADVEALLGGGAAEEPSPAPRDVEVEQQSSLPTYRYLSDLTPAQRRYVMSHWP